MLFGNGTDEAFHVKVDVNKNYVERWAFQNNMTQEVQGTPGEGTSIDILEPFILR